MPRDTLKPRPRIYDAMLADHFARHRQMALVSGPRQVGKTTLCTGLVRPGRLLNWDDVDDRRTILAGPASIARAAGLEQLSPKARTVGFDELHKFPRWKSFLKGFYDTHGKDCRVVVTGSSRLDVFRRGGDSLMGRYFLFHMHPFSVGELLHPDLPETLIRPPARLREPEWNALWTHGGYPEPFLKRDRRFWLRWSDSRFQQLVREEIRELGGVQNLGQLEAAAHWLAAHSGATLVYSSLANDVRVSVDTARRWVDTLGLLHFGFLVRPWFKNVAKSLRKEPKWYLRDWSAIADPGARAETFVACHLLKTVDAWNDLGLGRFELRYLRDKQQREVDFAIIKDGKPWLLAEVKHADRLLSPALGYFQRQLGAAHALQVVLDAGYVQADCFQSAKPLVVPARTFLSQLV